MGIKRNSAFTPSEMDLCLSSVALLAVRTGEISLLLQASVFLFVNRNAAVAANTALYRWLW